LRRFNHAQTDDVRICHDAHPERNRGQRGFWENYSQRPSACWRNDKKHKNQQYDLSFSKDYTCRTAEKTKMKVTDWVVGSDLTYELNGTKAKLKTLGGKQVNCTLVRVANTPPAMR